MKFKTPKFNFLITVVIMIANILCVLWTPFRNRRDLTHPKSGSDVKTDNAHKPRKYEKVYYLHNKAFQGKQSKPPGLA